jgi:hypothetical protein
MRTPKKEQNYNPAYYNRVKHAPGFEEEKPDLNLMSSHELPFSSIAHRLIASFVFNCLQRWAHNVSVS